MSTQEPIDPQALRPAHPGGGKMAVVLGAGAVLYTLLAAGCAVYLLWKAYSLPTSVAPGNFTTLAVGALVAVVGTGLTGLAAVYSATRQSATAYQVAQYSGDISANLALMKQKADSDLAEMKGDIDKALTRLKSASDESLTRLKLALDAGQTANRELFGVATVYFHTLRTSLSVNGTRPV
jgi:hypothetical protein